MSTTEEAMIRPFIQPFPKAVFGFFHGRAQKAFFDIYYMNDADVFKEINGITQDPKNARLFLLMQKTHPELARHAKREGAVAEVILHKIDSIELETGRQILTYEERECLIGGMLVHDLGKLTFTDKMMNYKRRLSKGLEYNLATAHTAIGGITYHYFGGENNELIESIILNHHARSSSRQRAVNWLSDRDDYTVPTLNVARFRRVAVMASLIDHAVANWENRQGKNNNPKASLTRALDSQIVKIYEFIQENVKSLQDVTEEEINLYEEIKKILIGNNETLYNLVKSTR